MDCEFCETPLGEGPANVTLLAHLAVSEGCDRDFRHLIENIRASWTATMSGG